MFCCKALHWYWPGTAEEKCEERQTFWTRSRCRFNESQEQFLALRFFAAGIECETTALGYRPRWLTVVQLDWLRPAHSYPANGNCNVCQNVGTTAKRRGLYPKAKVLQKDRYVKPGPVDPMFLCEGDKWTGISRFPGSESSNQVSLLSSVYIAVTLIVS
jgi:hypothetical protein